MRLGGTVQNRITLLFEYWRQNDGRQNGDAAGEELIARGEQVIACMRREGKGAVPTPIPGPLREALKPYA